MGRKGPGIEVRDASIRLSFTVDGTPQRRTLKLNGVPLPPTAANEKRAHRIAAEIKDKIAHGVFVLAEYFPDDADAGDHALGARLDVWLGSQRVAKSTLAGYTSAVKFWKEALDDHKSVRAILPSDIKTAIAKRPKLSGKTVNNYVSVLRETLALCVEDRILTVNPAIDVKRAKYQKPPPDPFTRDEAEGIITHAAKHYPEQVYNFIEARFFTGVRTGESFGQRWPNVDLRSKYIMVAESIVAGEEKETTKTHTVRKVILNSRALEAFKRQAKHTRIAGEHVFLDPRYEAPWMDERAFRRSFWEPAIKALGIRYRKPYNMRHTYATMMLMAGMTPAFCASQLGHSVEMFLTTYSKWIDGGQNDVEMARLEATLGNNPGKKAGDRGDS
jgi:integrase